MNLWGCRKVIIDRHIFYIIAKYAIQQKHLILKVWNQELMKRIKNNMKMGIKKEIREDLVFGLVCGLVGGLVYGLACGLIDGLVCGIIVGLIGGLVVGLIAGLIYNLVFGLIYGLVCGLAFGITTQIIALMQSNPEFSLINLILQLSLLVIIQISGWIYVWRFKNEK